MSHTGSLSMCVQYTSVYLIMVLHIYQVLQELHEVFPAVESALKATQYEPNWSTAWQTLGRAQLGLGEVLLVSYALINLLSIIH